MKRRAFLATLAGAAVAPALPAAVPSLKPGDRITFYLKGTLTVDYSDIFVMTGGTWRRIASARCPPDALVTLNYSER